MSTGRAGATDAHRVVCECISEACEQLERHANSEYQPRGDRIADLWHGAKKALLKLQWCAAPLAKLGRDIAGFDAEIRDAVDRADAAEKETTEADNQLRRMQKRVDQVMQAASAGRVVSHWKRTAAAAVQMRRNRGPEPCESLTLVRAQLKLPQDAWKEGSEAGAVVECVHRVVSRMVNATSGFLAASDGCGSFTCVFNSPRDALLWTEQMQLQLLRVDCGRTLWAEYSDPSTGHVIFSGARLACAVSDIPGATVVVDGSGRTQYCGADVSACECMLSQAAGGEVLLSAGIFRWLLSSPLQQCWAVAAKPDRGAGATSSASGAATRPCNSAVPASLQGRLRTFAHAVAQGRLTRYDAERTKRVSLNPSSSLTFPGSPREGIVKPPSGLFAPLMLEEEDEAEREGGLSTLSQDVLAEIRAAHAEAEKTTLKLVEREQALEQLAADLAAARAAAEAAGKLVQQLRVDNDGLRRRRRKSFNNTQEGPRQRRSSVPRGTPSSDPGDDPQSPVFGSFASVSRKMRAPSVFEVDPSVCLWGDDPLGSTSPVSPRLQLPATVASSSAEQPQSPRRNTPPPLAVSVHCQTDSSCVEMVRMRGLTDEEKYYKQRAALAVELRDELLDEVREEVKRAGGLRSLFSFADAEAQTLQEERRDTDPAPPAPPPVEVPALDSPQRRPTTRRKSVGVPLLCGSGRGQAPRRRSMHRNSSFAGPVAGRRRGSVDRHRSVSSSGAGGEEGLRTAAGFQSAFGTLASSSAPAELSVDTAHDAAPPILSLRSESQSTMSPDAGQRPSAPLAEFGEEVGSPQMPQDPAEFSPPEADLCRGGADAATWAAPAVVAAAAAAAAALSHDCAGRAQRLAAFAEWREDMLFAASSFARSVAEEVFALRRGVVAAAAAAMSTLPMPQAPEPSPAVGHAVTPAATFSPLAAADVTPERAATTPTPRRRRPRTTPKRDRGIARGTPPLLLPRELFPSSRRPARHPTWTSSKRPIRDRPATPPPSVGKDKLAITPTAAATPERRGGGTREGFAEWVARRRAMTS